MDLNNFTHESRRALVAVQNIWTRLQHQEVDVEHGYWRGYLNCQNGSLKQPSFGPKPEATV